MRRDKFSKDPSEVRTSGTSNVPTKYFHKKRLGVTLEGNPTPSTTSKGVNKGHRGENEMVFKYSYLDFQTTYDKNSQFDGLGEGLDR